MLHLYTHVKGELKVNYFLDYYEILWDTMPYEKNNENKTNQKLQNE